MINRRVCVTGAGGFVGGALVQRLAVTPGGDVLAVARSFGTEFPGNVQAATVRDIGPGTDWSSILPGCDTVIHCAARVHVMHDRSGPDAYAEYRRVNLEGTMALARQAAQSGVRRFVFLSSIKVNGEETVRGQPFSASQRPAPADPYGVSKMEAERALLALAAETGMEVVIIRPPLVYGPGVKANFLTMMRVLHKRIPLPLGSIDNKRSLVALDNLVDLIIKCIDHPAAANEIFLVSDGDDMSTTDLLRRLATALGVSAYLIPLPGAILQFVASLLGKGRVAKRLCGSLEIDIEKTRTLLDWEPVVSVDEALRKTALHWLREQ